MTLNSIQCRRDLRNARRDIPSLQTFQALPVTLRAVRIPRFKNLCPFAPSEIPGLCNASTKIFHQNSTKNARNSTLSTRFHLKNIATASRFSPPVLRPSNRHSAFRNAFTPVCAHLCASVRFIEEKNQRHQRAISLETPHSKLPHLCGSITTIRQLDSRKSQLFPPNPPVSA